MISEEMLRQAAHEAGNALLAALPEPEDCNDSCSKRFETKMVRLIRRTKHPVVYKTLSRVASILLVVMITASVWLSIDARARQVFFGWIRQIGETHYTYHFAGDVQNSSAQRSYEPTWLPENWVEIDRWTDESGFTAVYSDGSTGLFYFSATLPSGNALIIYEGREGIQTNVNNNPATYYLPTETDGNGVLVWEDSDSHILFSILAAEPVEDLLEIAKSVQMIS